MTVKTYLVNLEKDEVEVPPVAIRCLLSSTVGELEQHICATLNIDQSDVILISEKYTNELQILEDKTMALQNIGSNKVSYVLYGFNLITQSTMEMLLYIDNKLHYVVL